jgi:hypothetical protein
MVPGVKNGVGLNNIGLLVRIAGQVTYKTGSYIYVDDGSNVENLYGLFTPKTGVMVRCPGTPDIAEGDMVGVTGIVEGSIPNNGEWTTNRAYLHMRDWMDLSPFDATPTTGAISGTVTASAGGAISGATITTSPGGYTTTTNTSGAYALSSVPAGTYTVTASKSGYVNASQSGVVVNVGQTTTVNLAMNPNTGTLSGTVTVQGGAGLAGATVATSTGGYTTTSGSNGAFSIPNVAAGTYSVTASKAGYTPQTKSSIQINAGQTTTTIFTLSPSAPVDKLTNGNFEGGFYNTGWGSGCSGLTSQLPNPSGSAG